MLNNGEQLHIKSNLTLIGDSNISLASASETLILWEDPYKNKGNWVGAVENVQYVKYITQITDIQYAGQWKLQIKATIASNVFYGAVHIVQFEEILE